MVHRYVTSGLELPSKDQEACLWYLAGYRAERMWAVIDAHPSNTRCAPLLRLLVSQNDLPAPTHRTIKARAPRAARSATVQATRGEGAAGAERHATETTAATKAVATAEAQASAAPAPQRPQQSRAAAGAWISDYSIYDFTTGQGDTANARALTPVLDADDEARLHHLAGQMHLIQTLRLINRGSGVSAGVITTKVGERTVEYDADKYIFAHSMS